MLRIASSTADDAASPCLRRSNFINVTSVHVDCDGDSLIYMGVPDGPSCHTVRGLGCRQQPAMHRR